MLPNLPFFLKQKLSQQCHYKCQLSAMGSLPPGTGRCESLTYKEYVQKFYQSLFHPSSADGFPTISQWPLKLSWGRSPGFAHKSGKYIFIMKKRLSSFLPSREKDVDSTNTLLGVGESITEKKSRSICKSLS